MTLARYLRAVGRKVLWSSAYVCVSVRTVFVRKISQERVHGSPPNLVGGTRGWTCRTSSILVLIGFRIRIQDHFSISVNLAGWRFATSSKYTAWAMLATASAQVCVPSDTVVYISCCVLKSRWTTSMQFFTCFTDILCCINFLLSFRLSRCSHFTKYLKISIFFLRFCSYLRSDLHKVRISPLFLKRCSQLF